LKEKQRKTENLTAEVTHWKSTL